MNNCTVIRLRVFIDAWGWITLYNKREKRHKEIKDWFWNFQSQQGIIYTTDYVLDEAFTLIFRRVPFVVAKGFERIPQLT